MLYSDLIKTTPYFVNEKGIKWWADQESTSYARRKNVKDVNAWLTQFPDGSLKLVLTKNNEVVHEDTTIEGIACYIDALKMIQNE